MNASKNIIRSLIVFHTGDEKNFSLEHRFFNVISYVGGVIGVLTILINVILRESLLLTLTTAMVAAICWLVFYLSRFRKKFKLGKWILTFFIFAFFNYIFFINNGSRGPVLYLYMAFFLLILIVWQGGSRWFFIGLFYVNVITLLIIEMKFPGSTKPYPDETTRLLDVYLSYFMYIALLGIILMFVLNNYIREKIRAERSDNLKSAFLANMSHEIRTPMNAILGFTQLLNKDISKEKRETYIRIINENSQGLLRLIEDIIDVSKIEAGELEIKEKVCNLDDVMHRLESNFNRILEGQPEKNIEIRVETAGDGLFVKTDCFRLQQVLTNLMHNAVKYTSTGKIITGYSPGNKEIRFFVKDTGIGIREEYMDVIFDRFRKIETEPSARMQPGTGIGLAISKNLVNLLGGEIGVHSTYGEGSEFFFTIPYKPAAAHMVRNEDILPVNGVSDLDLSGRKILIAEDERTNFFFLKKALEYTGVNIIRARNGKEAVDLVRENTEIDLVLMDILMPEMDGYEATGLIKKLRPRLPVIAQTALAMEGDKEKVLEAGCDAYVSKPVRIRELLQIIRKYLDAPGERPG